MVARTPLASGNFITAHKICCHRWHGRGYGREDYDLPEMVRPVWVAERSGRCHGAGGHHKGHKLPLALCWLSALSLDKGWVTVVGNMTLVGHCGHLLLCVVWCWLAVGCWVRAARSWLLSLLTAAACGHQDLTGATANLYSAAPQPRLPL